MLKKTIRLLKALRPEPELRRFDGLKHGQLWAERGARFAREAEAFWGSK